jgi:hypothetical protein
MGFDLHARRKDVDGFHMGAFSWSWMLDAGVGLPVGYGPGFSTGQFLQQTRPDGLLLAYNDGARVSAAEAKQMAAVARWVAAHQDALYREWEKLPEDERKLMQENTARLYRTPVRRDFVEKVRAFAEWAEKSGGFTVY